MTYNSVISSYLSSQSIQLFSSTLLIYITCLLHFRDIAARNILVSRPDCVKLADFGMSLILTDKNDFQGK